MKKLLFILTFLFVFSLPVAAQKVKKNTILISIAESVPVDNFSITRKTTILGLSLTHSINKKLSVNMGITEKSDFTAPSVRINLAYRIFSF